MLNFFARLDHRGTLRIRGPEARKFLQGQTTCDVEKLTLSNSLTGAFCNPQGRMICDFRLLAIDDEELLLLMHADLCEPALEAFGKYIVFSRAELSRADDCLQYAAWGPGAASLLQRDPQKDLVTERSGAYSVAMDELATRLEICVPHAQQGSLVSDLLVGFSEQPATAYQLLEIDAGIGHLCAATQGQLLPQMLNYQHTGQVSFNKGCYTGQEVVARMHYRGKVKRPMLLASADTAIIPDAGTGLFASNDGDSQQSIGQVINAAPAEQGIRLLVSVARDRCQSGVRIGSSSGPELEFLALPYPLEAESG